MTLQPHWRCQKCKQTMTAANGSVYVYNANAKLGPVGNYPIEATEDEPPPQYGRRLRVESGPDDIVDLHEIAREQTADAVWLVSREPNIGFGAYHHQCDPFPVSTAYRLSEFPGTIERYAAWVFHLEHKTWMGKFDLMRMVGFWWTHKGEHEPDLSH